jgi:hypothetical protein
MGAHGFDMATHQFGGWGYVKLKRRLSSAVSFILWSWVMIDF